MPEPPSSRLDVVVLGEPLVEVSALRPLTESDVAKVSMSGDALNASVAARLGGAAEVAIVTRRSEDELGRLLLHTCERHGVRTDLISAVDRPMGVYFAIADPDGSSDFVYRRDGSAASTLEAADVADARLEQARALLISGAITAVSRSAVTAAIRAAELVRAAGGIVVYDPNHREPLQSAAAARETFAALAPLSTLVTPSCPGDSQALFDSADPAVAIEHALALGAEAAAVTLGDEGVLLGDGDGLVRFEISGGEDVVDATGAGDMFAGVTTARLGAGDRVDVAVRYASAAAAISVRHHGGLGGVSGFAEIEAGLAGITVAD